MSTTTKMAAEIGFVRAQDVATSTAPYFTVDKLALRLDGTDGRVVAGLTKEAAIKLRDELAAWVGDVS